MKRAAGIARAAAPRRALVWAHAQTLGLGLVLTFAGSSAFGQDHQWPWLSAGGLLFGDVYHLPSHHLESGDGATGLVVRRGYLTLDADFGDRWDGRLRFELNQSGEFETYTLEVDVKDLWLSVALGRQTLVGGLAPTPTFGVIESQWGKRYLMRTPMDLQGVASRDTGLSLSGPLDRAGRLNYTAMIGTGIEFGAEAGDGRKWMLALDWSPTDRWLAEVYVDYEKLAGPTDRTTLQGFLSYRADDWRWGLQYSDQDREDDPPLRLASSYWIRSLRDDLEFIGRVDRVFEPSPRGDNISYIPFDPTAPATLFLAGLEYAVNEHFSVTPNVVVIDYDRRDDGSSPKTDVFLRLTAFINFE